MPFAISTNCSNTSQEWDDYYQYTCWEGSKYFKPLFAFIVSNVLIISLFTVLLGFYFWKTSIEASGEYLEWYNTNADGNYADSTSWTLPG